VSLFETKELPMRVLRSRSTTDAIRLTLATVALFLLALPAAAQRGDDAKRASKNGKTEGVIDGVSITLEFGRPKVKDRQIWGQLVPYDKVWRTGADEATTITFSSDVMVEGKRLPAGTYGVFSVPAEDGWTWAFNQQATQWGSSAYDQGKDALRVTVKPTAAEHVEELDFRIEGSSVVLRWEKLAVPFRVQKAS
jgi:hypothetical protein